MNSTYRTSLTLLKPDDAEPGAAQALRQAEKSMGMIPNMYAAMANSPGVLQTYAAGYSRFREESGFTPAEQEVVLLTISRENGCSYCMGAHSFLADNMSGVPKPVTDALRGGTPIPDERLAALSHFTRTMFTTRGRPSADDVQDFLRAGFSERQVLEIILALAVKTLSNYSNHVFHTPLDDAFSGRRWEA